MIISTVKVSISHKKPFESPKSPIDLTHDTTFPVSTSTLVSSRVLPVRGLTEEIEEVRTRTLRLSFGKVTQRGGDSSIHTTPGDSQ